MKLISNGNIITDEAGNIVATVDHPHLNEREKRELAETMATGGEMRDLMLELLLHIEDETLVRKIAKFI